MNACSVDACAREGAARGLCHMHWKRWRKYGNPTVRGVGGPQPAKALPVCAVASCGRQAVGRGYCNMHYARLMTTGDVAPERPRREVDPKPCAVADCETRARQRGFCVKHFQRWQKYGTTEPGHTLPDLEGEEWRAVVRWEGVYEVSSAGRVRRIAEAKGARPGHTTWGHLSQGYRFISLKRPDGEWRQTPIHRLVAEAFIGPPPTPRHQVNHKDSDRAHNRVDNLEWVTPAGNMAHAIAAGRMDHRNNNQPRGERNHMAKLTDKDVRRIRELKQHLTYAELTRMYPVTQGVIHGIVSGRMWRHVT